MTQTVERRIMMRPDEAKHFVHVASQCDFDIDIFYNRFVVDAKSILGVLALDFSKMLTIRYNGYNSELENCLKSFSVAC